jgi:hypothetical protein
MTETGWAAEGQLLDMNLGKADIHLAPSPHSLITIGDMGKGCPNRGMRPTLIPVCDTLAV